MKGVPWPEKKKGYPGAPLSSPPVGKRVLRSRQRARDHVAEGGGDWSANLEKKSCETGSGVLLLGQRARERGGVGVNFPGRMGRFYVWEPLYQERGRTGGKDPGLKKGIWPGNGAVEEGRRKKGNRTGKCSRWLRGGGGCLDSNAWHEAFAWLKKETRPERGGNDLPTGKDQFIRARDKKGGKSISHRKKPMFFTPMKGTLARLPQKGTGFRLPRKKSKSYYKGGELLFCP